VCVEYKSERECVRVSMRAREIERDGENERERARERERGREGEGKRGRERERGVAAPSLLPASRGSPESEKERVFVCVTESERGCVFVS